MTSSSDWWAPNLFKGRIGEALVEAVLAEFGYSVTRSGYERPGHSQGELSPVKRRFAPDLVVTHPRTQTNTYVEVKARTARPMRVLVQRSRLEAIRLHYPGTILAFVSAYDGSVNCANADDIAPDKLNTLPDGLCEINLLEGMWRPIWHFFPLVKSGERLKHLWQTVKTELHSFGERRVYGSEQGQIFEDERESLIAYIEGNWAPRMLEYDIRETVEETIPLSELRKIALKINAFLFASELLGKENISTREFHFFLDEILGESGERYIGLDLHEVRDALRRHPKALAQFLILVQESTDRQFAQGGLHFLSRLYRILPEGVGKAYLHGSSASLDDAFEIDLKAAIAMVRRRNCLDSEPEAL